MIIANHLRKTHLHTAIVFAVLLLALFAFAAKAQAATLSLSPSKSSVPIGESFSVDIALDTEGRATDGVDIHYLRFDPALLEVQNIEQGALFPSTQTSKFDNTAGTISFSQITIGGGTFAGEGVLATVTFKAIAKGKADVTFDFEEGNTTDSNVASAGSDVLSDALGGSYRTGGGGSIVSWIGDFFKKIFSFLF